MTKTYYYFYSNVLLRHIFVAKYLVLFFNCLHQYCWFYLERETRNLGCVIQLENNLLSEEKTHENWRAMLCLQLLIDWTFPRYLILFDSYIYIQYLFAVKCPVSRPFFRNCVHVSCLIADRLGDFLERFFIYLCIDKRRVILCIGTRYSSWRSRIRRASFLVNSVRPLGLTRPRLAKHLASDWTAPIRCCHNFQWRWKMFSFFFFSDCACIGEGEEEEEKMEGMTAGLRRGETERNAFERSQNFTSKKRKWITGHIFSVSFSRVRTTGKVVGYVWVCAYFFFSGKERRTKRKRVTLLALLSCPLGRREKFFKTKNTKRNIFLSFLVGESVCVPSCSFFFVTFPHTTQT